MEWKIYKHTAPNGKVYLGQTKQTIEARWENGNGYSSYGQIESVFYRAIKKYGWENFTHEILEENILSQDDANQKEIYWIEYYRSYVGFSDCNGYNMTKGGTNCDHLGYAVCQISKTDLSVMGEFLSTAEASRAISGAEGNASQIRRCCEGKKVSCKGFYWCYKENYVSGWKPKDNQLLSSVLQIDDDMNVVRKYESITECVQLTGFSSGSIISCCQRKQRKANGYYWCYTSDYHENWEPAEVSFLRNEKIYCFELDQVYESSVEATNKTGANQGHILRCCHGLENGASSLHFCYLKDRGNYILKNAQKRAPLFTNEENILLREIYPRQGICDELMQKFPNRTEDALRQQAHRLHLKYSGPNKHLKKVRCKGRFNKVFSSIDEAYKFFGLKDGTGIAKCCNGQRKTCAEHQWEYVK